MTLLTTVALLTLLLWPYLLWPYLLQVNEVHLSESNHDRVQALLEASSSWDFNALDLVGPTNNHSLLFLGYWLFVQVHLPWPYTMGLLTMALLTMALGWRFVQAAHTLTLRTRRTHRTHPHTPAHTRTPPLHPLHYRSGCPNPNPKLAPTPAPTPTPTP